MKRSYFSIAVFGLGVLAGAIWWTQQGIRQRDPGTASVTAALGVEGGEEPKAPSPNPNFRHPLGQSRSIGQAGRKAAEPVDRLVWERFAKRESGDLQAEWREDGRLVFILGRPSGPQPGLHFSRDAEKVRARAIDVVQQLGSLLSASALSEPIVQPDEFVAKAYFRQQLDGLPLMPSAAVAVSLGASGEILRVDNGTIPAPMIENSAKLSADDAARIAMDSARSSNLLAAPQMVAWNLGDGVARRAWSVQAGTRTVVVDAQSGEVLSSLDRKIR